MEGYDIEKLTLREFMEKVRQLRYNQRRFRCSKKLDIKQQLEEKEKEVDSLISLFFIRQQKLF